MRVLLIQPPSSITLADRLYLHEPLALEYLGAGLIKDGHVVALLDARIEPDYVKSIRDFSPDIIGLTGYTSNLNAVKTIASKVKTINPEIYIIVGGHHATVLPEDYNLPYIDLVVIGEGTFAIREVLHRMRSGESLIGIQGLAFPGVEMKYNEARRYTDLNELPFPDRSLSDKYRSKYRHEWMGPLASLRTSLGCTGRCSFCSLWSITGGKYLRRKPESIIEELASIKEDNIFFCDDESMLDHKRMDRIADLIFQAGINKSYFLYARVDTIIKHPELFNKWKEVGLRQVFIGMESFSNERLNMINKGTTVEQQAIAVKILKDLGILAYASFQVDPKFERADFKKMRDYVRCLKLKYVTFAVLTPLPGSRLYKETENELLASNAEMFDLHHALVSTNLDLKEFYQAYADLHAKALPFRSLMALILKHKIKEILPIIILYLKLYYKIKNSYRDHVNL